MKPKGMSELDKLLAIVSTLIGFWMYFFSTLDFRATAVLLLLCTALDAYAFRNKLPMPRMPEHFLLRDMNRALKYRNYGFFISTIGLLVLYLFLFVVSPQEYSANTYLSEDPGMIVLALVLLYGLTYIMYLLESLPFKLTDNGVQLHALTEIYLPYERIVEVVQHPRYDNSLVLRITMNSGTNSEFTLTGLANPSEAIRTLEERII